MQQVAKHGSILGMLFTFSKDDTCISVVFITGYQESANLFHLDFCLWCY